MSADDRQVAGEHYKLRDKSCEHWNFVHANGLNYMEGQITKYVTRCRKKGQCLQDLEKARHFLDKYIEQMKADEGMDPFAAQFEREIGASRRAEGAA